MVKNKLKNKSGVTLVELLVAIVIFSTVVGVTYGIYINNMKYIDKENIKTQLQNEAQVIDSTFLQLGMQSEGIEDVKYIDSEVESIDMKYKNENNEEKIIRWKLEDKKLKLQVIGTYNETEQIIDAEYVLSENIKYFNIKSIDGYTLETSNIINVEIKLERIKGFNHVEYPLSIMVTFRNKN